MSNAFIVDFQDYGLEVKDRSAVSQNKIQQLGDRIIHAFKTYGFCYLKNHGVDEELVRQYFETAREFFEKPVEFKTTYTMDKDYRFGWVPKEVLNKNRSVGDLHEAFNYMPTYDDSWPLVDNFEELFKQMYSVYTDLSYRVCDVLSLGLGLPVDFMRNAHRLIGEKGNITGLRTLYYPPIQSESIIGKDQVRLGEHIDWGTVAFNFQDNVGGLEVKTPQGEFVSTDPIPGTVLVTVSTLLQRWTSDSLTGSVHRILIPEEEYRRNSVRQAAVFFLTPDSDYLVKCLDGSDKYEPVLSGDYLTYKADVGIELIASQ